MGKHYERKHSLDEIKTAIIIQANSIIQTILLASIYLNYDQMIEIKNKNRRKWTDRRIMAFTKQQLLEALIVMFMNVKVNVSLRLVKEFLIH